MAVTSEGKGALLPADFCHLIITRLLIIAKIYFHKYVISSWGMGALCNKSHKIFIRLFNYSTASYPA